MTNAASPTRDEIAAGIRATRARNRRRRILMGTIAAALVAIAATAIVLGSRAATVTALSDDELPATATSAEYGVVEGAGAATIVVYFDFLCPSCRATHAAMDDTLAELVSSGQAHVIYHPMTLLNDKSNPEGYSTRATAIAGCAAEAGVFVEFTDLLLDRQPTEGTAGYSKDELVSMLVGLGANRDQVLACARDSRYVRWAQGLTDQALARGVVATPTILVNDKPIAVAPSLVDAALRNAVALD